MASNPIFSILWLILLFVLAWPVAVLCAGIWVILMPLEACFGCTKDINNTLEGFVKWPQECGSAIKNCSSSCPAPN